MEFMELIFQMFGSNPRVILTRQPCGSASARAWLLDSKRRALAFYCPKFVRETEM